jgi:hypothetical protein
VTTHQLSPTGGPLDACWHNGSIYVAWQDGPGPNANLVVRRYSADAHLLESVTYPLGSDVLAFPRLLSALGNIWLIYREGASKGGNAVLLRDGVETWRSTAECGGNDPVCLGFDTTGRPAFAWQRSGTNEILSALTEWPHAQLPEGIGRPTGLSHFDIYARVVLVDDARGAVAGMTRPSWAGTLVAGEHPDTGALVKAADGRVLHLWQGQDAYTPRLSYDGTSRYACVTWGKYGIRLAVFTEADVTQPVAPYPPGDGWTLRPDVQRITTTDFLFGAGNWARSGAHVPTDGESVYTHQMQQRQSDGWVQHTKQLGVVRGATWTLSASHIGLSYDGTNEMGGYRLVNPGTETTAPLYPRTLEAGTRYAQPVQVWNLLTDSRDDVVWQGWLEAVYDGPAIGSIPAGRYALIAWTFDRVGDGVDGDPRGSLELNLCRDGYGPVAWFEYHRSKQTWRRWFGVSNVPRIPDPLPRYSEAAPAFPTAPQPPPEDKPPMSWYNDADATPFRTSQIRIG